MGNFYKKDGTDATLAEWISQRESCLIGDFEISKGGENVYLFSRYTGLKNGEVSGNPCIHETGITGNPDNPDHNGIHGYHKLFCTEAECLTNFNAAKAALQNSEALP